MVLSPHEAPRIRGGQVEKISRQKEAEQLSKTGEVSRQQTSSLLLDCTALEIRYDVPPSSGSHGPHCFMLYRSRRAALQPPIKGGLAWHVFILRASASPVDRAPCQASTAVQPPLLFGLWLLPSRADRVEAPEWSCKSRPISSIGSIAAVSRDTTKPT
jgi:hypothetical protein